MKTIKSTFTCAASGEALGFGLWMMVLLIIFADDDRREKERRRKCGMGKPPKPPSAPRPF